MSLLQAVGWKKSMRGKPRQQPSGLVPKNWPANLPYLTTPRYSPGLRTSHLSALRTGPPASAPATSEPRPEIPPEHKPGPSPHVRITPIADPRHPAYGQCGLFAARDLRPGELVVVYLGEIHVGTGTGADEKRSDYDLWLDRDADVAVDAARAGNEARFVNDYRGVPDGDGGAKSKPNAEFRAVWDARRGERAMAIFVLRMGKRATGKARTVGVAKGEEILVTYGKGFWGGEVRVASGADSWTNDM